MGNMGRNMQVMTMGVFFVLCVSGCNAQNQKATAQKEDALRGLRDSGVITDQEYQQRLTQLHGSGHAAAAKVSSAPGHMWHMKKAEISQTVGWDPIPRLGIPGLPPKKMTALTMMVPTDWSFQGGPPNSMVVDCNYSAGRLAFLALNPDKTAGMAVLPASVTMWTDNRAVMQSVQMENQNQMFSRIRVCELKQPQPLSQTISERLQVVFKGNDAVATGPMEPIPGAAAKLEDAVNKANQSLAQQGAHIAIEAGRIPVRNRANGITSEGYLTVIKTVRTDRLPGGGTVWTTDYPLQAVTLAPPGKYAQYEAMYTAMLDSVWVNPEYMQSMWQLSGVLQSIEQRMRQDNANAARAQAQIWQGVQNYANHVFSSVAADRSAAFEHSAQQFSLYMGDQAQYHDPTTGGIVQLPSGSNHVWASQTGNTSEYILTDSPSFNPNGQVGSASWTEMQAVR